MVTAPAIPRHQSNKHKRNPKIRDRPTAIVHAVKVIHRICCLAGSADLIDKIRADFDADGVRAAIRNRETVAVFDWLIATLSFQGIADQIAYDYMEQHGYAGRRLPQAQKLLAFPRLPVQQAQPSLAANDPAGPDRLARMRDALIAPLREIYGVSDKVLTMALSSILLGAPSKLWREVGASMIAIDTLVHNFLHRTGILHRFDTDHAYGSACYRPGGCADIIEAVAERIDASAFNPAFPAVFPRFVQHAIWRYCAQSGLDVCNGNRIDDRKSCNNMYCQVRGTCDRVALRANSEN